MKQKLPLVKLPRDCPETAQRTYDTVVQNPKATIAGDDINSYWEIIQGE